MARHWLRRSLSPLKPRVSSTDQQAFSQWQQKLSCLDTHVCSTQIPQISGQPCGFVDILSFHRPLLHAVCRASCVLYGFWLPHCSRSRNTAGRPYEQRVPHPEPLTPSRAAAADTLFTMSAPESPARAAPHRRTPMGSPSKRRQKHASTTRLHAPAGAGNGPGKRAAVSQAQGPAAKKASSVPEVGKLSSRAATAAATAETGEGPSAAGPSKSAAKR